MKPLTILRSSDARAPSSPAALTLEVESRGPRHSFHFLTKIVGRRYRRPLVKNESGGESIADPAMWKGPFKPVHRVRSEPRFKPIVQVRKSRFRESRATLDHTGVADSRRFVEIITIYVKAYSACLRDNEVTFFMPRFVASTHGEAVSLMKAFRASAQRSSHAAGSTSSARRPPIGAVPSVSAPP